MSKVTISIIKCDVGSLAGHYIVPKPLFDVAEKNLKKAIEESVVNNFCVFNAGDDLELLMVDGKGEQNPEIHKLAWDTFKECADKASQLKLYAAGQDLLKTTFSGRARDGSRRCRNGDRGTRL